MVEIISRSSLRADCGSFHKLPGPSRGPGFGKTCVSLGCVRPLPGGPIRCSSPRAPPEGSFRLWPSNTLDTRPRGMSRATPLGGCYVTGHDPSSAHAGGRVTPDRGLPPHIPHLRAGVSRDRWWCLATPSLGQGETLPCDSLSACPWGLAQRLHTAGDRQVHRAGAASGQSYKAVTASGDRGP